ncbi:DUF3566 domain-containing protein [Motilibacter sp. K478]|nr:DUF3566 domain-containing protein [Motilibacter aurantiacus]
MGRGAAGQPAQQPAPGARPARRARLVLSRVDPWSVMKLAALASIALGIMLVVAVFALWSVLNQMGVFEAVTTTVGDITSDSSGEGTDLSSVLSLQRVMVAALILAAVDAVLITALSTIGAFLYNVSARLVGGLHVTLTEDN